MMIQPRMSHTTKHNRRGFAIILAMFITMAFMLVMADMMKTLARIQEENRSDGPMHQAEDNAKTGMEIGLLMYNHPESVIKLMGKMSAGQPEGTYKTDVKVNGEDLGTITIKLVGTATSAGKVCEGKQPTCTDQDEYFIYPFPGTGTVGGDRCDPNKISGIKDEQWYRDIWYFKYGSEFPGNIVLADAIQNQGGNITDQEIKNKLTNAILPDISFIDLVKNLNVLDHPCLWNNITEKTGSTGSTEEIPLYRKITSTYTGKTTVIGPENLTNLTLTVKLPCNPNKSTQGQICTDNQRYILGVPPTEVLKKMGITKQKFLLDAPSLTAIHWDMVSSCEEKSTGKKLACSMVSAYDEMSGNVDAKGKQIMKPLKQEERSKVTYGDPTLKDVPLTTTGVWSVDLLDDVRKGIDHTSAATSIKDFLTVAYNHTNPTMHLFIANFLYVKDAKDPDKYIDRVEYQIRYKSKTNKVPFIINPTIIATGTTKGYTITLETRVSKHTGTYGYSFVGKK